MARPDRPDETALFAAIRAVAGEDGDAVITRSTGSTFASGLDAVRPLDAFRNLSESRSRESALIGLSGSYQGVCTLGEFLPGCGSVAEMEGLLAGARFPAADTRLSRPGVRKRLARLYEL